MKLPERAIDYVEKYLSNLTEEERDHVMKVITLAQTEGQISYLQLTLSKFHYHKGKKDVALHNKLKRDHEQRKNVLRMFCHQFKLFYECLS